MNETLHRITADFTSRLRNFIAQHPDFIVTCFLGDISALIFSTPDGTDLLIGRCGIDWIPRVGGFKEDIVRVVHDLLSEAGHPECRLVEATLHACDADDGIDESSIPY